MFKLDLEKAEEPDIKLPTSVWITEKAREFQKDIYFCFIDYAKAFDYVDHKKPWKILQYMGIKYCLTCLLSNLYAYPKKQLEPDLEQWTSSKSVKNNVKTVYRYHVYLIYMQNTSGETLGWMKHKLESRLLREMSITSKMQMSPTLWQKAKT